MRTRRVVITGLGVVAPNGIGKEAFWESLIAGKSAVDYITAFDPTPYACKVAAEVRNFNPSEFMTARKAKTMGRFSQFAIAATRLALEDARLSITPSLSTEAIVAYGTSVSGGGDVTEDAVEARQRGGPGGIKPWSALEFSPHAPSSYVAIEFKITGPALTISSNCCTGLDVLYTAFSHVSSGRAKAAVAGSCDAPIAPLAFGALCALSALTKRNDEPQKASRPYDLLRDGLVVGEGAATLVLEELEFARDRGAHIYAEILGYGAGSEAIGMRKGDLGGTAMARAMVTAIRDARLSPPDIDHINAHGSSLPDFDVCDSNAFKLALGEHAYRIPISSIKSMIGQPFAAAGTIQTVAACLSIERQQVPPTINQEIPDPRCDLDYVPNRPRVARVKRVLINGHSFGGSVSAIVVGQPET